MQNYEYIEDCLILLYKQLNFGKLRAGYGDSMPINNFYDVINRGTLLTKNQGNFILKLLRKYSSQLLADGFDIQHSLDNPKWKQPFRTIDYSKKIDIDTDENKVTWVTVKFPYAFKDTFVKDICKNTIKARWDPDKGYQKIKISDINLINFYEETVRHGFHHGSAFIDAVELVEEIWNNQESVIPYSVVENGEVVLKNASQETVEYYNTNKTNNLIEDKLLAKSMGFPLSTKDDSIFDNVSKNAGNLFWIKDQDTLVNFLNKSNRFPAVVILDRVSDVRGYTHLLVDTYERNGYDINDIKVCFRFSNEEEDEKKFNQWVKDKNLGADIANGKIYICLHKPPKWMFRGDFNAKTIISNSLYPSTNNITSSWLTSHPTVIFYGNIRPTEKRIKKIVEL